MKRILSWIVMFLLSVLANTCTSLVIRLCGWFINLTNVMNLGPRIVCYLFFGTTLLSILFIPAVYGAILTSSASEAVCPTKKGTRYIVYSVLMLVLCVYDFVVSFQSNVWDVGALLMCIYYIVLLISSRIIKDTVD